MTSAIGGYQYESTTTRALGSITIESYDHRDQAKTVSKLISDVSYMAGLQRKMQKGIDDANENFVQQIQGLLVDFLVLLGGGGDTGFDFGDLKYILQLFGSLFGLSPGMPLPINLFQAAWHFFSNYIFPVGNFQELINQIIDSAIATMLDIFGEIPIVGQAIQQMAVIISNIRDLLMPAIDALENLFAAFGGDFGSLNLGPFQGMWDKLMAMFNAMTAPIAELLAPIFSMISSWTLPFVDALGYIVELAGNLIDMITGGVNNFSDFVGGNYNPLAMITNAISNFIQNGLLGKNSPLNALNIFGLLKSFNLPFIPFGHIGNTPTNLLVEPGFTSEDSIQVGPGWIWDNTDGRTSLGCAKATASSAERTMESVAIEVGPDQEIQAKVWAKWTGLVYTGDNPITVDLIRYTNETEISRTTLAGFLNPSTNQPTWYEFASSDYIIPDDGTNFIKLQFRVRSTASAGSVWFDDADLRKESTGMPQNWILNLIPDLGGIRGWIQDVIDAIISAIRGIPFVGGSLANLISWITGWQEDTEEAAAQASDAYIGLGVTQQIIIAAATGGELDSGVVTTDQDELVQAALADQTAALIAVAAQVDQIQATTGGNEVSGVSVIDPVEDIYEDELDPALWQEFTLEGLPGDGWMETPDGQNISMSVLNNSVNSTKMYRWIGEGEHTLTNYQKVTASISRGLTYPGFGDGRRPHLAAYCRVSDDGTKWVRAYIDNVKRLVVDFQNGASSGSLYTSGTDSYGGFSAGSKLSIEPGVGTDERSFRIWRGNEPIRVVEDDLLETDVTQKGHGIGMRVHSGFGTGRYNQYTAVDNAPVPTQGIGFRAYRSNAAGINKGGTGDTVFPADCLDTVENIGAGMSWDSTTQTLTINVAGWYLFGLQIEGGNIKGGATSGSFVRHGLLYKEISGVPTVVSRFGEAGIDVTAVDPNSQIALPVSTVGNGIPIMYCAVGSKWMPGEWTNDNHNIFGHASGAATWFSCALLNRSTA